MGKKRSARERRLQRLLIPLNIVVCLICLAAMLSLFFAPILKIDFGKILRDEEIISFIEEKVNDSISDDVEDANRNDIDYKPVVTKIVKSVVTKAEGSVDVSAKESLSVLTHSGDDKLKIVLTNLLFGDSALVTELINSLVDAVGDLFETPEGKAVVEDAVISIMTQTLISSVDDATVKEAFSNQNVKQLVDIMRDLSDPELVPNGNVDAVAEKFVDKIDEMFGEEVNLSGTDRAEIKSEIQNMYDIAKENLPEGTPVSVESVVCVAVSQNVNLSEFNIDDLINQFIGGIGGGGDGGDGGETGSISLAEGETDINGEGETGGEQKVVTDYGGLLEEMGYTEEKKEELKSKLRTSLNDTVENMVTESSIVEYIDYYGYLCLGVFALMFPWLVLFLFSFFHLFAKNKRFTMWYVKLFGWIPALVWLVVKTFVPVVTRLFPELVADETSKIALNLIKGVTSYTWICGLCYIILWVISIFWAHPIKKRIKRERRSGGYESDYDDYDDYE